MFWPLVLPFQITCAGFAILVIAMTVYAIAIKKGRAMILLATYGLAFLLFIPSCIAVSLITDYFRFGTFRYDTFDQVRDFRIERYLPPKSTDITLCKYGSGHLAKYSIAEADLKDFLDDLWKRHGQHSVMPRNQMNDGVQVEKHQYSRFESVKWPPLNGAIALHSPRARNGAGATYFYDPVAKIAYHDANYW